jgi:hypothetical protein
VRAVCEPDADADNDAVRDADGVSVPGGVPFGVAVSFSNEFADAVAYECRCDAVAFIYTLELEFPSATSLAVTNCIADAGGSYNGVEFIDAVSVACVFPRSNMLRFANVLDDVRILYAVDVTVSNTVTEQECLAKHDTVVLCPAPSHRCTVAGVRGRGQLQFVWERARFIHGRKRNCTLERVFVHGAFDDIGILRLGHVCND